MNVSDQWFVTRMQIALILKEAILASVMMDIKEMGSFAMVCVANSNVKSFTIIAGKIGESAPECIGEFLTW